MKPIRISKKLSAYLIAVGVMVVTAKLRLPAAVTEQIQSVTVTYLLGQAGVDGLKVLKGQ
jgi:hypothetical protein